MSISIPATLAGNGLNAITAAIKALYGVANDVNAFLDEHVEAMKASDHPTISRTGRVIEAAKYGFGIGYAVPIAIIATGQLLLGNTLTAVTTVATAATLTNPVAMTCASVGAIYYGWGALSDVERDEFLEKLSTGLGIGVELIRSIIRFVIEKISALLSKENLDEIKAYISAAAEKFGRTLGDVTKTISDQIKDTVDVVVKKSGEAMEKTKGVAAGAYRATVDTAEKAAHNLAEKFEKSGAKADPKKIEDKR